MKLRTLARGFRPLAFVAVLMLLAAHESGWHTWPWLDTLEWQSYDLRQRWLAPQAPDPRIVIVDVDERSLQEPALGGEGRWPWPRKRLAELLRKLIDEHQVSLVAMDFIFAEPDRSSGLPLLDDLAQHALQGDRTFRAVLEQLRPGLEYDQLFAQQIARVPVVLGAAFHSQVDASPNPWPSPIDPALAQGSAVHSFAGLAAPLPIFREAAAALGHLNPVRDTDGVTRRIPMLVEHQQQLYPSLSLATAAVLSQADAVRATKLGAFDFVLKPFDPLDLVATLRALARRSYGTDRLDQAGALPLGAAPPGQPFEPLSPRETQVFAYIVKGYTNLQIGHLLAVKPDTVKKHRARIFEKYGVASLAGLIEKLGVLRALP